MSRQRYNLGRTYVVLSSSSFFYRTGTGFSQWYSQHSLLKDTVSSPRVHENSLDRDRSSFQGPCSVVDVVSLGLPLLKSTQVVFCIRHIMNPFFYQFHCFGCLVGLLTSCALKRRRVTGLFPLSSMLLGSVIASFFTINFINTLEED